MTGREMSKGKLPCRFAVAQATPPLALFLSRGFYALHAIAARQPEKSSRRQLERCAVARRLDESVGSVASVREEPSTASFPSRPTVCGGGGIALPSSLPWTDRSRRFCVSVGGAMDGSPSETESHRFRTCTRQVSETRVGKIRL